MSQDPPAPADAAPRLRVLLLAELCNPELRQAPLIGWSQAQAIRARADAHIVTAASNRDALTRAGLHEGADFTALDISLLQKLTGLRDLLFGRGSEKGWTLIQALNLPAHYQFEWLVRRRFGAALKAGRYDVVHRLTPISPTQPSPLATWLKRIDVPFVAGPLNGGLPWPRQFRAVRKAEGEWTSHLRGLADHVPGHAGMRRDASALIAGSIDMLRQLPAAAAPRTIYLPENGIDPARFSVERRPRAEGPLRVLFLGRLVPFKGPDMLLEAAAGLLREGAMTLTVTGTGPLLEPMRARAAELGVPVTFTGDLDHRQVQEALAQADVMCAPSIREFGGAVVMEAMYMGAVPMVVDYGGPPEYATPDCAIVLPLSNREGIIAATREALTGAAADPTALRPLSERGQAKARALFTWDAKARMLTEVYAWAADPARPRPDFGTPLAMRE